MDEERVVDIGAGHFLAKNRIKENYKKIMTDVVNFAVGGNLPDTVMEYANMFTDFYSSTYFNARNILQRFGETSSGKMDYSPFYLEKPRSKCNLELYTGFWYAYIYTNGSLELLCNTGLYQCDKEVMTQVRIPDKTHTIGCKKSNCRKVRIMKPPCKDPIFSDEFNISSCCNFPNISKAMPHNITLKPSKDTRRNFNPFIPLCQYAGEPELLTFRSCNMFSRAYTDMGIGFTFNSEKFDNIYKPTEVNVQTNMAFFFNNEKPVVHPKASGKNFQLKIVIDANNEEVELYESNQVPDFRLKPKPFLLTVHDPFSPASLRS